MEDDSPVTVGTMKLLLKEFFDERFEIVGKIVEENRELRKRVDEMEEKMDELSQYSRRNNIIIHGIPIQNDEDPIRIAMKACEIVGVKIGEKEIDSAHRLPSKNTQAPPFIMKMICRFTRDEVKRKAKENNVKASAFGGDSDTKLFYSDHLTKKNQELLTYAKELKETHYIWSNKGKILGRAKDPGSKVFQIKTREDVDRDRKKRNRQLESPAGREENGLKNRKLDQFRYQTKNTGGNSKKV